MGDLRQDALVSIRGACFNFDLSDVALQQVWSDKVGNIQGIRLGTIHSTPKAAQKAFGGETGSCNRSSSHKLCAN